MRKKKSDPQSEVGYRSEWVTGLENVVLCVY